MQDANVIARTVSLDLIRYRLRILAQEINGEISRNETYWIQANINGGSYVTLTTSDQGVGWKLSSSGFVSNGEATTEQLTGDAGGFTPGKVITQSSSGQSITLGGDNHMEMEYSLEMDPSLYNANDVFQFRMVLNSDVLLGAYLVTPQITYQIPNLVTLAGVANAVAGVTDTPIKARRKFLGTVAAQATASSNEMRRLRKMIGEALAVAQVFSGVKRRRLFAATVSAYAHVLERLKSGFIRWTLWGD